MAVYLDGARIFNAALAFNISLAELCQPVDCLQFCLSKGLAAPVGSVIVGGKAFIDRARWIKQRIGGGMRQAGHMAAAGIVALEKMLSRLSDDHENACYLASGLAAIDERLVDRGSPLTNIVHINFGAAGRQSAPIVKALIDRGVKIKQIDEGTCRMITHWGIDKTDIDIVLAHYKTILS
jgi:threonine aldolase